MALADPKTRILNAAEQLFGEQGYGATSLRDIIKTAGVNLSAIHYYFRSKEGLLEAVVERRAAPVNRERLEMLAAAEREAGVKRVSVERVMEAFLLPAFHRSADPQQGAALRRLMGRLHLEAGLLPIVMRKNFAPVIARFSVVLKGALPGVAPEDVFWRLLFASGAMARTLTGMEDIEVVSDGKVKAGDPPAVARKLVAFLSAGFRAGMQEKKPPEKKR
jgi:AcrR family transcriptional regulator